MAVLAVGLAGAAIGSAFGYAAIGWAIGIYLGQQFFGPKPPDTEGPRLDDLSVTSSTYGNAIPIIYGTARIAGNIIWSAGLKETKHEDEVGGKGAIGGSSQTHTTYTYSCSFAIALAEGEATQIIRIWADGKLLYDLENDGNSIFGDTSSNLTRKTPQGHTFHFYPGSETQTPSGLIMSHEGTNIPAFQGLCYVVFEDMQLADFGNRIPNITCEVAFTDTSITYPATFTELPELEDPWGPSEFPGTPEDSYYRNINYLFLPDENLLLIHRNYFIWAVDPDTFAVLNYVNVHDIMFDVSGTGSTVAGAMIQHLYKAEANDKIYALADGFNYQASVYGMWGFVVDPNTLELTLEWSLSDDTLVMAAGKTGMIFYAQSTGGYGMRHPYGYYTNGLAFDYFSAGLPDVVEWTSATGELFTHALTDEGKIIIPVVVYTSGATRKFELGLYVFAPNYGGSVISNLYDITSILDDCLQTVANPYVYMEEIRYAEYDNSLFIVFNSQCFNPSIVLVKFSLPTNFDNLNNFIPTVEWTFNPSGTSTEVQEQQYDILGFMYGAYGTDSQLRFADSLVRGDYHPILSPTYFYRNNITGQLHKWDLDANENEAVADWSHYRWEDPRGGTDIHTMCQLWRPDYLAVYGFTADINTDTSPDSWDYRILWKSDPNFEFSRTPEDLAVIVRDICSRVDLVPANDVDVIELEGTEVLGYVISRQTVGRSTLEQLSTAYLFDMVESDYKLIGRFRGRAPAAVLSEDEFVISSENVGGVIKETRAQEVELPVRIDINFKDYDNDYQPNMQSAKRSQQPIPTMESVHSMSIDLPIVERATFMKRLSEQIMYAMWLNRVSYEGTTSWRWLKLDPTDVIYINLEDGTTFQARIMEMTFGGDLSVPLSMISDDAALYSSSTLGDGGQGVPSQSVYSRTKSILFMLDVPLLRDIDSQSREQFTIYYAIAGTNEGWPGAVLYSSSDNITYNPTGQAVTEVAWGVISNVLPHTDTPFLTDEVTQLEVYMQQGESTLASVTKSQMLTDAANAAAVIQPDGETEIIQFQNVTDNGDGTFTLDTLFRGRRGTDIFVNGHNSGEKIVMLSATAVEMLDASLSQHNVAKYYKGVTYGTLLDDADTEEFAPSGRDLMPWAPVHQEATENAGDIDLTWVRRTRINGHLRDGSSVIPLNEDTEEYEIVILNGPGGAIVRTITSITSPSYTYLNADIISDFGSVPSELTLMIYQISAQVGRGFTREVTIPVE